VAVWDEHALSVDVTLALVERERVTVTRLDDVTQLDGDAVVVCDADMHADALRERVPVTVTVAVVHSVSVAVDDGVADSELVEHAVPEGEFVKDLEKVVLTVDDTVDDADADMVLVAQ
jgi:hypothetical protein